MLLSYVHEENYGVPVSLTVGVTAVRSDDEPAGCGVSEAFCVAIFVVLAAIFSMYVGNVLRAGGPTIFGGSPVDEGGADCNLPGESNDVFGNSILHVGVEDVGVTNE